ncbi:LADA_0C09230g1_1 [Lachancea dasiensis]|uniref:LADA_0C09230g1_1 n=1 Tax=Lachancea dasiensis TaxID=1072105 RepID=A0A1G4J0N8_9SACH|nr:LADA_0C09230g1_1 [Lachancea dasiensis]
MNSLRSLSRRLTPSICQHVRYTLNSQRPTTSAQFYRSYAQSWDERKPNKDINAHLQVQKLLDEIQSHPNVAAKLREVSEIMVSKGLANESAPPGPWQVVKILTDKDVRKAMSEFKEELANSGIEVGPDQLGPLMTVLGMEKKD